MDHTLGAPDGHYMRVHPANMDVKMTYKIPITDPIKDPVPLPGSQPMCLKFWYYMGSPPGATQTTSDHFFISTPGAGNVNNIDAQTLKLFNSTNQWLYQRVDFKATVSDVLTITGRTSSDASAICFDDIQVQRQSCERPGWCDFENGLDHHI